MYLLENGDKCEVQEFFEAPANNAPASGFRHMLDVITGEKGFIGLPAGWFDSWDEGGELFTELIKGPWRISCFREGRKLLLATVFRKRRWKEKKEYKRAIALKRRVDVSGCWKG